MRIAAAAALSERSGGFVAEGGGAGHSLHDGARTSCLADFLPLFKR